MYVFPLLYRLSSVSTTNHLSITRIRQALHAVVTKHGILRTALYLDTNSALLQHCLDATDMINRIEAFAFSVVNLRRNDRHIDEIINEILTQSNLFDLSKGRVIHCHIIRQFHYNHLSPHEDDLLTNDDLILFSIHHAVFDGASTPIFLRDFCHAYENNGTFSVNDNMLQYIDYSVHERVMNMSLSREFWQSQLRECNLQQALLLPVDRHHVSTDQRSGLAHVNEIIFDDEISMSFLNYASLHNLTLFQLGLATFYVFLYKLTHGQNDLCISSVTANRYRSELQDMIGMFVATLPYRFELDPHWSFDEVVKHVQEKCLSILKHSHYSLQQILADFRLNQSNVPFLHTMFAFATESSDVDHFCLCDVSLKQESLQDSLKLAKFDFFTGFIHNSTPNDGKLLSCHFVCSRDLFDQATVTQMAQRFQHVLHQLFSYKSNTTQMDLSITSINKLSLILPEESEEIKTMIFHQVDSITKEGMTTWMTVIQIYLIFSELVFDFLTT